MITGSSTPDLTWTKDHLDFYTDTFYSELRSSFQKSNSWSSFCNSKSGMEEGKTMFHRLIRAGNYGLEGYAPLPKHQSRRSTAFIDFGGTQAPLLKSQRSFIILASEVPKEVRTAYLEKSIPVKYGNGVNETGLEQEDCEQVIKKLQGEQVKSKEMTDRARAIHKLVKRCLKMAKKDKKKLLKQWIIQDLEIDKERIIELKEKDITAS